MDTNKNNAPKTETHEEIVVRVIGQKAIDRWSLTTQEIISEALGTLSDCSPDTSFEDIIEQEKDYYKLYGMDAMSKGYTEAALKENGKLEERINKAMDIYAEEVLEGVWNGIPDNLKKYVGPENVDELEKEIKRDIDREPLEFFEDDITIDDAINTILKEFLPYLRDHAAMI